MRLLKMVTKSVLEDLIRQAMTGCDPLRPLFVRVFVCVSVCVQGCLDFLTGHLVREF